MLVLANPLRSGGGEKGNDVERRVDGESMGEAMGDMVRECCWYSYESRRSDSTARIARADSYPVMTGIETSMKMTAQYRQLACDHGLELCAAVLFSAPGDSRSMKRARLPSKPSGLLWNA